MGNRNDDRINYYQADTIARKIIKLIQWNYGLRALIEALQDGRLTYSQYMWALKELNTRDVDKKMKVAYWCIKRKNSINNVQTQMRKENYN